jgi:hypothetical protein
VRAPGNGTLSRCAHPAARFLSPPGPPLTDSTTDTVGPLQVGPAGQSQGVDSIFGSPRPWFRGGEVAHRACMAGPLYHDARAINGVAAGWGPRSVPSSS